MSKLFIGSALFLSALSLALGCSGELPLEDRACPCTDGWVCCQPSNTCVAEGTACAEVSDEGDPSAPRVIARFRGDEVGWGSAQCMTVDDRNVYFKGEYGLFAVPKSGGVLDKHPGTIEGYNPRCGLVSDGAKLYATSFTSGVQSIALSPDGASSSFARGTDSTTSTFSNFGEAGASSVAVEGDAVYVSAYQSGQIVRVRGSGSDRTSVALAAGRARPDLVAFDERNVYWLESTNYEEQTITRVMSVPKTGGEVVEVAQATIPHAYPENSTLSIASMDLFEPHSIVVSNGRLFWSQWLRLMEVDLATPGAPATVSPLDNGRGMFALTSYADKLIVATSEELIVFPLSGDATPSRRPYDRAADGLIDPVIATDGARVYVFQLRRGEDGYGEYVLSSIPL